MMMDASLRSLPSVIVMALAMGTTAAAEDLPITPDVPLNQFQNRQEDVKPYDFNAPPEGLFREITLAAGFEEELGFRRSHEIIPQDPTDTFTANAPVFVVFHVHQHYEPYQVFGVVYPEEVTGLDPDLQLAQDAMLLALEDESGYVKLSPPPGGWKPGRYKINIHVGWQVNDVTHLGVMRFTVPPAAAEETSEKHHGAPSKGSRM